MAPPGRFSVTVLSPIVYAGLVVRRFFFGIFTKVMAVFWSSGKFLSSIVHAGLAVCRFFIGFLTNAMAVFLSIGKFRYAIVRKQ